MRIPRISFRCLCLCYLSLFVSASASSEDAVREWSDATGRFKITGTLVEVVDGNALIKSSAGKTIRIPIARLSKPDQAFLSEGDNPFEIVEMETPASKPATPTAGVSSSRWDAPQVVNWDDATQMMSMAGVQWQIPDSDSPNSDGSLGFEPKRAALSKKSNFHENLHPLAINIRAKRAAVGTTVSFGIPKAQSRLSLVELVSGKSVHSDPVEGHMRPLALMDDGSSVLMVGCSDDRGGYETKRELQLWRFDGKKIVRSSSWTPYQGDHDAGRADADVLDAQVVGGDRVLTMSDKGHLVLWDLTNRKPLWHARLSERNFAMKLSTDRKLLAVFDEKTLMVLNPETAEILGSTALPPNTPTGWCRLAWSANGKRIMLTSIADVRVMDTTTGEWAVEFTLPGGPVATNALSFPNEQFALLDNRLLVDLESRIQVCEYQGASQIETVGDTSFIAVQSDAGGVLAPAKLPHPAAVKMLETAQSDPSLFLLHPGVTVSIDVSAVSGPDQQTVKQGLEKSVADSGYKLSDSSPIKIVALISDPKQEAVSYIAAGSYVVTKYTSTVKLEWNGKTLWSTSGSNVPGMLMTKQGETMQEALENAGKAPNTSMFAGLHFPEFMQKPSDNPVGGNRSNALMSSQFTLQGLIDSK